MDKYKFDEYKITEKDREYSVIVFPKVEYMWAFDDYPEENRYMVDGTAYAYKLLKLACAILVSSPDKIIYFPCKQEGIGHFYRDNYYFVLCTPQVQLRRSNWVRIRVANHGITARERIVSSQKQRDKEAAGEIRKNYIRYWNRALTIWGLMFTITLVIIVFF